MTETRDTLGFLRLGVASPAVVLGDPAANAAAVDRMLHAAAARAVAFVAFPELNLTGYTTADLLPTDRLRAAAVAALDQVAAATAQTGVGTLVGLPLEVDGRLFDVAAVVASGEIAGVVPKTFLPSRAEFYEARWFSSARDTDARFVDLDGRSPVPFGADLLFEIEGLPAAVLGVEICEDLWAPSPPSGDLAAAGATIILNPSASDELVGKAHYRRELVRAASGRLLAGYAYAASGPGESSTDLVFGGHSMIAEHGTLLAEATRFDFEDQLTVADVDLVRLRGERLRSSSFSASRPGAAFRRVAIALPRINEPATELLHPLSAHPFVPADGPGRDEACEEVLAIASTGLARRLRAVGNARVTLGLSGGSDSALALLITHEAFGRAGLSPSDIIAVSMPGLGTGERTTGNATRLAGALGVTFRTIPISDAARSHLSDIGHDGETLDITFENAQARERTQVLMDLGNLEGAFVVGTGDLSEIALGWATYSGDHLSMYHVNAGIPKTLVRTLLAYAARTRVPEAAAVIEDILATPVSPELLPPSDAAVIQDSEASVGPFELADFFLYHLVRLGASPRRVRALALLAFDGRYDEATITRWLRDFIRRFFGAQFKRSAMPDGPKVGTVALSPRGDWRMPSDATPAAWLADLEDSQGG
jgi:NAD+ synthase (glutamine-hydrolysing)